MKFKTVKGDLFKSPKNVALAHCIGSDAIMGAGIAVTFVKEFPFMRTELQNLQNLPVGSAYLYSGGDRPVINLVTKAISYGKPTRGSFSQSILAMKELLIQEGMKEVAFPLMGSGLDRLDWGISEDFIKAVFADTDIELTLYVQ